MMLGPAGEKFREGREMKKRKEVNDARRGRVAGDARKRDEKVRGACSK